MKLLLDTHIWIWLTLEPKRLVGRVARVLDNPEHDLWPSPIRIWELRMLAQKGEFAWMKMQLRGRGTRSNAWAFAKRL